ncbi:hypothetical protein QAD02_019592 [Eretmocerus hayati]|uniref:Uncharacterized protein n=1 Tax=Eretmocerus hayati TaxID=131215 RepID=A0ACC2PJN7_9HYME|nr:hypothetical protein QAD02_019592 [Eretmocerus hayati]
MVVFTCNHCGDSLQKPKVAKHYQFQCRRPAFLTCVDCLKDFRDEEYVAHTKCLTENQRYGGKDFVQKPSANKGEKKQQTWLTIVNNVLTNSTNLTQPERNLLNNISKYENIPRKKAKFLNFIRNACGNRVSMPVVESVWDKMEKAMKDSTGDSTIKTQENGKQKNGTDCTNNVKIEKNKNLDENGTAVTEDAQKKKSKKRKVDEDVNGDSQPEFKKKSGSEQDQISKIDSNGSDNASFSWKRTILEIVSAKTEISMKKLKKKVVARYLENFPEGMLEEASAKFEKKLKKVSQIVITDNVVRVIADAS